MRKLYFILSILLFSICPIIHADEIILKNGNILEGNILDSKDSEKDKTSIDLILNGELIGMIMCNATT